MEQPNMMSANGMSGQGMNHMNGGMQRPQPGNPQSQLHAAIMHSLSKNIHQFQNMNTWQTTADMRDRASRIMQLVTQLRLINPDFPTCLQIAQKWESRTFAESATKEQYIEAMDRKLKEIHLKRQQQQGFAQTSMAGQMSNGGMMHPGAMNGMMGGMPNNTNPQNPGMNGMNSMGFPNGMSMQPQPQQSHQMNGQNPMFPTQLQRPMQPTGVNAQNQPATLDPSALQVPQQQQTQQHQQQSQNVNMGQGNPQQRLSMPNNGQGRPGPIPPQVAMRARQQYEAMSQEQKNDLRQRYMSHMSDQQKAQAFSGGQDPLMRFIVAKVKADFDKQRAMAASGAQQNKPPGMAVGNNMNMPVGTNATQRPPSQTSGQNFDFSNMLGQQANALKLQDAGEQVVPASNNNNNSSMGLGNQPSMPQNINPQMLGNQANANAQNGNGFNQQQAAFYAQQRDAQQAAQQQERLQKQAMAQRHAMQAQAQRQSQLQGQPGGLHAPNAFNGGGAAQANSPAMSMLNRPMAPPGQATPGTPQPNRQQAMPQTPMNAATGQLMQHHQNMLNQNTQQLDLTPQQLNQMLQKVPPHFRERLQGMSQEQVRAMLARMANTTNNNRQQGQSIPPGGQNQNALPNGSGQNPQATMQPPGNTMPGYGHPTNQGNIGNAPAAMQQLQMTRMRQQLMDSRPFPRQILAKLGVSAPQHLTTWMQLKQHVAQNNAVVPQDTLHKINQLQIAWAQQNAQELTNLMQQLVQQRRLQAQPIGQQLPPQPQQGQQQQLQHQANMGQQSVPMGSQATQIVPPVPNMQPPTNRGQGQPALGHPGLGTITPLDIQTFRERVPQAQTLNDDQIRHFLHRNQAERLKMRQQQLAAGQHPQFPVTPGPRQQTQGSMPNQPNQMPQRTSQALSAQAMVGQTGAQKPMQQSNDDVIEISSQAVQQHHVPQAPAMQARPSQQGTPSQRQGNEVQLTEAQRNAHIQKQQQQELQRAMQIESLRKAQQGALQTTTGQNQSAMMGQASQKAAPPWKFKLTAMMAEVANQNPKGPPIQYDEESRKQIAQGLGKLFKSLKNLDATHQFAIRCSVDDHLLKEVLRARWIVTQNTVDEHGSMKGYYSVTLANIEELNRAVNTYLAELKKRGQESKRMGAGHSQGQGPPSQSADTTATAPTQQGHIRKASAQAKAPPAPTENKTFDWAAPSPHGVPKYEPGRNELTPDKLKFPPQKKRKTGQPDSQASTPAAHTGTPAATGASPALGHGRPQQSPEQLRKAQQQQQQQRADAAEREAEQKKFRCKESTCDASLRGFETEDQLKQHEQTEHQPIEDPLQFLLSNAATSLGVDGDGNPLQKSSSIMVKPPPAAPKIRVTVKDLKPEELTKHEAEHVKRNIIPTSVKEKLAKKQAEMDSVRQAAKEKDERTLLEAMSQRLDLPSTVGPSLVDTDKSDDAAFAGFFDFNGTEPWTGNINMEEVTWEGLNEMASRGTWVPIDDNWTMQLQAEAESDSASELTPSDGSSSSHGSDISQSAAMRFVVSVENDAADLFGTGNPGVAESMVPLYHKIKDMMNEDISMEGTEELVATEGASPKKRKLEEWDLPIEDFIDDFWAGGAKN